MDHDNRAISISTLDEPEVELAEMIRDVRAGLSRSPKDLSPWPKYFYDAEGSRIFDEITGLPEYYQTSAEYSILRKNAREIISRTGCREIVELGSGSASKTRALLDALVATGGPVRYIPLDVSESALAESGARLVAEYPELEIRGYVGDFDRSLGGLLGGSRGHDGERLVVFLGGTIGNFVPKRRGEFLSGVRDGLLPGDHVLIGLDLVKSPAVLEAAYDDATGVTARFNKNLLKVLNRRLGADFDPDLFRHRATYDEDERRIEMWLDSLDEQRVHISALGEAVHFNRGEGMRTETSAKFTPDSVAEMFANSGLELLRLYADEKNLFGLALGAARDTIAG